MTAGTSEVATRRVRPRSRRRRSARSPRRSRRVDGSRRPVRIPMPSMPSSTDYPRHHRGAAATRRRTLHVKTTASPPRTIRVAAGPTRGSPRRQALVPQGRGPLHGFHDAGPLRAHAVLVARASKSRRETRPALAALECIFFTGGGTTSASQVQHGAEPRAAAARPGRVHRRVGDLRLGHRTHEVRRLSATAVLETSSRRRRGPNCLPTGRSDAAATMRPVRRRRRRGAAG